MSMITEQVERLRTLADIAKDIADNSTDTVKTLREAADTIEQLAAKVRAENNESQPCEDAISRQAVNEIINDIRDCISVEGYWAFLERLKKLPPVNPQEPKTDSWSIKDVADTFKKHGLIREQEPKTGHWKYYQNDKGDWINECSVCGSDAGVGYQYPYCPNCGAKMVEPQETETWNGIHAQITAPKSTFERIFNDADDDSDI